MTSQFAASTLRHRVTAVAAVLAAAVAFAACADYVIPTRPTASDATPSFGKGAPHGVLPILFSSDRDGNYEIYKMNPDGSGQTRLTFDRSNDNQAVWSPNGQKIAFYSTRQNGLGDIYVMNADGSGVTRLTTTVGSSMRPSWSPDGAKLVFQSTRDAADPTAVNVLASWELYTMNADGSGVVRITNNSVGDSYPAWSPDGKRIAFVSDRDHIGSIAARDLYTVNVDGTNLQRITNQDGQLLNPSWDSKSRRIAYSVLAPAVAPGVYFIDLMTNISTRLTSSGDDVWESWSPDGTQLAYVHYVAGSADIYLMNADGSGKTQITTNLANDSWPHWSR